MLWKRPDRCRTHAEQLEAQADVEAERTKCRVPVVDLIRAIATRRFRLSSVTNRCAKGIGTQRVADQAQQATVERF